MVNIKATENRSAPPKSITPQPMPQHPSGLRRLPRPSLGMLDIHFYPAILNMQPAFREPAYSLNVCMVLGLQHAGGKCLRRVVAVDRDRNLVNDRAGVVLLIDEVHGAAR